MIPHNIPINGRIAIVDDQIEQARPLMNLFGKLQIPYVYYDNDYKNLPEEGSAYNDVRILLLDINLLDNTKRPEKQLKPVLISVIKRIISDKNYPYLLIYWSRHENEYHDLIKDIFTNDLPTKAPVSYLSLNKSDFVRDDGELIDTKESAVPDLFERIKTELGKFPVYAHLMNWENQIHISADKTLEEIFKLKSFGDDSWNRASNHLFYKLALAYAGKNLKDSKAIEQIKSAFFSLNNVFIDSLEYSIGNNLSNQNYDKLETPDPDDNDAVYTLNKKLLLSDDKDSLNTPGIVIKCNSKKKENDFEHLLNNCLNLKLVEGKIRETNPEITDSQCKKKVSAFRKNIRESWSRIFLIVTPLCDFAQDKFVFNKIVRGVIIKAEYKDQINTSSESIFISPVFRSSDDNFNKILVLDFRHLFSLRKIPSKSIIPLFRVRQQLLAEIQSKLSRHMNRQGVLYLD